MLSRERVIAAFDFQEPDRIPWGEHLIDYNIFEEILGRPSYVNSHFNEQQAYWEGKWDTVMEHYKRDIPALTEALELDIVMLPSPFPERDREFSPMEKLDATTYRDQAGNIHKLSASNWLFFQKPAERSAPVEFTPEMAEKRIEHLQAQIDQFDNGPEIDTASSSWDVHRYIVEKMKPTHFVMMLGGGLGFPRFGSTEEEGWINMLLYPEVAEKGSELSCKRSMQIFRAAASVGLDGVVPCGDLGNSKNLAASPELYRRLVRPFQKMQAEEGRRLGLKVALHCCGHVWPVLPDLAEIYDAYEAIQPTAGMDIVEVADKHGDQIVVWGGIAHEHLIGGTPEDIRNDARHSFPSAKGGGFILGSSHSLAVGAKIENVLEMKKCRDEWGTYPISV